MSSAKHIENPDVILIGSGVMSATLGGVLKNLQPDLKIQLYEVTRELAAESSNGWNNAGTGHAGICELSYTPNRGADGEVDVTKAIEIFDQFEQSKYFWGYAVRSGMIKDPSQFVNPVPHIAFVYGQEQVDFLRSRHKGMSAHHFFSSMEYSADRDTVREWAPLLLAGRDETPIAATKMDRGTDVNFGALSELLVQWLGKQDGGGYATEHRVTDLTRTKDGWDVEVKDLQSGRTFTNSAKFVFIGAGGGSLPLLQKSGIAESKGFGGFPIGGQWLVCHKPEIVKQHVAKVYGMSPGAAPTMVGAAPGDMPYTLATCCFTISGLWQTSHWPPMGNPPKPLLSAMPLFCSKGKLPPPAPMKTNFAELVNVRPLCRSFTSTSQPSFVRVRSVTRCSVA